MITVTNTKSGSKLAIRRVNLLDLRGNIIGQHPDDHEAAVQAMQNNDGRTCRTMTVAAAMAAVAIARRNPDLIVEGDL